MYVLSAFHGYRSDSDISMARHSSDPSNTDAYCSRNWASEMEVETIPSISAWLGHNSERNTSLPSVSWPSGSVVRSMSTVPASA